MSVVTLLNRIEKFKSFVYKKAFFMEVDGKEAVVIDVRPRKNSPPVCRVCMKQCGTHATERPRRFEHVPFWGWQVYFQYALRRTDCPVDGALVECLSWAVGKERKTRTYQVFLASVPGFWILERGRPARPTCPNLRARRPRSNVLKKKNMSFPRKRESSLFDLLENLWIPARVCDPSRE